MVSSARGCKKWDPTSCTSTCFHLCVTSSFCWQKCSQWIKLTNWFSNKVTSVRGQRVIFAQMGYKTLQTLVPRRRWEMGSVSFSSSTDLCRFKLFLKLLPEIFIHKCKAFFRALTAALGCVIFHCKQNMLHLIYKPIVCSTAVTMWLYLFH